MSGPGSQGSDSNPVVSLLTGGDKWVQFATIALVVISGGGNFWTTMQSGRDERADILKAVKEMHDLHDVLDSTLERQKQIDKNVDQILEKLNQK